MPRFTPSARNAGLILTIQLLALVAVLSVAPSLASAAQPKALKWEQIRKKARSTDVFLLPTKGKPKAILYNVSGGGYSGGGINLQATSLLAGSWMWGSLRSKGIAVAFLTHREGKAGNGWSQIADVAAGAEAVSDLYPGVPGCIWGQSSGVQYAAMVQIVRPDLLNCLIADAGNLDTRHWLNSTNLSDWEMQFRTYARQRLMEIFGRGSWLKTLTADPMLNRKRVGDVFTIFGQRNADGSNADREFQADIGKRFTAGMGSRQARNYFVQAAESESTGMIWGHPLFNSAGENASQGRAAAENSTKRIYARMRDWIFSHARKPSRAAIKRLRAARKADRNRYRKAPHAKPTVTVVPRPRAATLRNADELKALGTEYATANGLAKP